MASHGATALQHACVAEVALHPRVQLGAPQRGHALRGHPQLPGVKGAGFSLDDY